MEHYLTGRVSEVGGPGRASEDGEPPPPSQSMFNPRRRVPADPFWAEVEPRCHPVTGEMASIGKSGYFQCNHCSKLAHFSSITKIRETGQFKNFCIRRGEIPWDMKSLAKRPRFMRISV